MSEQKWKVWPPFLDPHSERTGNDDKQLESFENLKTTWIWSSHYLPHVISPKKNSTPSCKSILLIFTPHLSASPSYLSTTCVTLGWHKGSHSWLSLGFLPCIFCVWLTGRFEINFSLLFAALCWRCLNVVQHSDNVLKQLKRNIAGHVFWTPRKIGHVLQYVADEKAGVELSPLSLLHKRSRSTHFERYSHKTDTGDILLVIVMPSQSVGHSTEKFPKVPGTASVSCLFTWLGSVSITAEYFRYFT